MTNRNCQKEPNVDVGINKMKAPLTIKLTRYAFQIPILFLLFALYLAFNHLLRVLGLLSEPAFSWMSGASVVLLYGALNAVQRFGERLPLDGGFHGEIVRVLTVGPVTIRVMEDEPRFTPARKTGLAFVLLLWLASLVGVAWLVNDSNFSAFIILAFGAVSLTPIVFYIERKWQV